MRFYNKSEYTVAILWDRQLSSVARIKPGQWFEPHFPALGPDLEIRVEPAKKPWWKRRTK